MQTEDFIAHSHFPSAPFVPGWTIADYAGYCASQSSQEPTSYISCGYGEGYAEIPVGDYSVPTGGGFEFD